VSLYKFPLYDEGSWAALSSFGASAVPARSPSPPAAR
jgi:hypothetical protein